MIKVMATGQIRLNFPAQGFENKNLNVTTRVFYIIIILCYI